MPASSWYRATADAATIPPHVAERALEWLVELQADPVSPQVRQAWMRWRAEHPDHERAWQRIESVRGRLAPLSAPQTAGLARAALATPRPKPRRQAMKTLAVLAFAGGLTWTAREHTPWRQWMADHRTAVGERRTVVLADGTRLQLNTDTAVDVRFDATARRVRLLAGEILVTTAKDPQAAPRPFFVETAQGSAHALGTRYAVRQDDADTEVCVFEGAVEIRPHAAPDRPRVLRAGACARYSVQAIGVPFPAEAARIAWADGFIVARSMRLDAFIAELRRYSRAALSCDPAIAGVRVSGSFPLDDLGKVLQTLASTLNLRKETTTRLWGQDEIRLVPAPRA